MGTLTYVIHVFVLLGLGMVAAARQKNPKLLIALDLFDWKLDIAKKCGADLGMYHLLWLDLFSNP